MDVNNSGQVHNVTVPRLRDDEMIMIHQRTKTLACEKQDDVQHVFTQNRHVGSCAGRFFSFLWLKAF